MSDTEAAIAISAVLFQEEDWWIAQCLEYDLSAQAKTLPDLHYELERVLVSHLVVSAELGQDPFTGFEPAPQKFWDMYSQAQLSLAGQRHPFRVPQPTATPHIVPYLKIAETTIASEGETHGASETVDA